MANIGNENLLEKELTVFLCSRRCPDETVAEVDNWLSSLDADKDCIICGGHSGIEKRVVVQLMERGIPLVWMLAEASTDRWHDLTESSLKDGKLLIMSLSDEEQASRMMASERNAKMIEMAKNVVVAYMDKGGMIERLLEGRDNVNVLTKQVDMKSESFCIRRDGGNIYFDIERGMSGKYVKISQTRKSKNGSTRKECVFVNAGELEQMKKAVDWALSMTEGSKARKNEAKSSFDCAGSGDEIAMAAESEIEYETKNDSTVEEQGEGFVGKIKSVFGLNK